MQSIRRSPSPTIARKRGIGSVAALLFAALTLAAPAAMADARSDALAEAGRLEKEIERLYLANKYPEALAVAKKELALCEKELGPNDAKTGNAMGDVGAMHLALGELHEAEPLLKGAVAILEKATDRDDAEYASALGNLGTFYESKNQFPAAEPYLTHAIDVMEKTAKPNPSALATYYSALAQNLAGRNFDKASKLFDKAIAIHEKLGPDRALIFDLLRYGNAIRVSQGGRAEPIYQRAHALALKSLGPADKLTGQVLRAFGHLFWGAGEPGHKTGEKIYQEGYDALVGAIGPNHPDVAELMQDWAVMKQIEGDLKGSLDLRKRADVIEERQLDRMMEAGSESDRLDYARKLYGRVDYAVQLALTLGQAEKSVEARHYALSMVLKRKGQVLDAMAGGLAALRANASPEEKKLLAELAGVRAELAKETIAGPGSDLGAYRTKIAALEAKETKLEQDVGERSARYRENAKPVTVEAVQQALPEGSELIEIFRWNAIDIHRLADDQSNTERYVAFIIQKDNHPAPFILDDAPTTDGMIHQLRNALSSPDEKKVYDLAYRTNGFLLRRMEPAMEKYKTIFLAPDGELNLVPFGALLDSHEDFLIRKYAFTYLSSGRDLLRFGNRHASTEGPTIFANPRYDTSEAPASRGGSRGLSSEDIARMRFPPLPGTKEEAEAIGKVVPGAKMLTGADATEGAMKALHSPIVLHVATHGFFLSAAPVPTKRKTRGFELEPAHSPAPAEAPAPPKPKGVRVENPLLRSGLALTGANSRQSGDEDGILTALEASDLDLEGTKLVVLSACETGVGDVKRGQGVFSLRRALTLAGAETQVMSLWEVDDQATKTLMSGYYDKLFREGKGRSEALREVQIAMLDTKATAHPFYWSAFIVSGNPSPIASAAPAPKGQASAGSVPKAVPGARGCGCAVPEGDSEMPGLCLLGIAWAAALLRRRND